MTCPQLSIEPRVPPLTRPLLGLAAGLALIALVAQAAPLAAGLAYTLLYLALTWRRPEIGLMLVLAAAPFPYDVAPIGAVKFSLAEYNLALAAVVLIAGHLARKRPLRIGPVGWPIAAYLAVCFLSMLVDYRGAAAVRSMLQMVLYMVVAVMVFASLADRREQLMPALYGLLGGCVVLAAMEFVSVGPYADGIHKNAVGAALSVGAVAAVELWFAAEQRRRRMVLLAVMAVIWAGLIFSLSRGAWVGAAAGVGVLGALRRQFKLLTSFALAAVPVFVACWLMLPAQSRNYAFNISASQANIEARYDNADYALKRFDQAPIMGVGVGLRKQMDATNIVVVTLAENGLVGLIAFALIQIVFLKMAWTALRGLPRGDPMYSLAAVGAAIMVSRLTHGMFDHYWSRGALAATWSAAGMTTLAYLAVKRPEARPAARRLPARPGEAETPKPPPLSARMETTW